MFDSRSHVLFFAAPECDHARHVAPLFSLTVSRRTTQLVEEMGRVDDPNAPAPDFKELLEEFGRDAVAFRLVGGYAVAFHGRPRATKDIDLVLEGSTENLARAARALPRFGAPTNVVTAVASMADTEVVFMGQPPLRIDFLQTIDGIDVQALFRDAISAERRCRLARNLTRSPHRQ